MYKLCKTEQSAARQRQLEQGLLQAMLQQPYEEISISDLCDRLGVPRKSFYRYFSSKDGALAALVDHTLMEYEQEMPNLKRTKKRDAVEDMERYFEFWQEKKALLDALERSGLSGILVERSTFHAVRERMMPKYLVGLPADKQSIALTFAVCGLLAMVIQWHHNGYQQTVREIAEVATMMLTRPLISGETE